MRSTTTRTTRYDDEDAIDVGDEAGVVIDGEEFYGTIISFDDEEGTVTIEDDESGEQVTGDQGFYVLGVNVGWPTHSAPSPLSYCPVCGCLSPAGVIRCPECSTFHAGTYMEEREAPTHPTPARAIDPSHYSLSGDAGRTANRSKRAKTSVRGKVGTLIFHSTTKTNHRQSSRILRNTCATFRVLRNCLKIENC